MCDITMLRQPLFSIDFRSRIHDAHDCSKGIPRFDSATGILGNRDFHQLTSDKLQSTLEVARPEHFHIVSILRDTRQCG